MTNCELCKSPSDRYVLSTEYSPDVHEQCVEAYKGGREMNLCCVCGDEKGVPFNAGLYCKHSYPY